MSPGTSRSSGKRPVFPFEKTSRPSTTTSKMPSEPGIKVTSASG